MVQAEREGGRESNLILLPDRTEDGQIVLGIVVDSVCVHVQACYRGAHQWDPLWPLMLYTYKGFQHFPTFGPVTLLSHPQQSPS